MRHFDKANAAHLYLARDILRWGGAQHFPLAADDGVIVADELCPPVDKTPGKFVLSAAAPFFIHTPPASYPHCATVQHFRRYNLHYLTLSSSSIGYFFPFPLFCAFGTAPLYHIV